MDNGINNTKALEKLCYEGARRLYGENLPEIVGNRLKKELSYINAGEYAELYLLVRNLVKGSNEAGYLVGFRGSIGASLAAFLTGVTEINPLCPHYICPNCHHSEFFEHGEYSCGVDMPSKVCPDCSSAMQADGFDIPSETFFGLNGDKCPDIDLNVAPEYYLYIYNNRKELLGNNFIYKAGRGAADTVKEGVPPAYASVCSIRSENLKLDIIPHTDPELIARLEKMTGISTKDIPLNDKNVMDCFANAETLGIPEFGTSFVRNMITLTKPTSFSDLIKILGLSHGTDVWENNAQYLIESGTARFNEVIAFRDDVMLFLLKSGLDRETAFSIAHAVRMGKFNSDTHTEYIAAMRKCGVPDWYIESCQKLRYLFPKAHSAAYVLFAVRIAYFKVYYSAQFYAAYLKIYADSDAFEYLTCGTAKIKKEMDTLTQTDGSVEQSNRRDYTMLELYEEIYERGLENEVLKLIREMDCNDCCKKKQSFK